MNFRLTFPAALLLAAGIAAPALAGSITQFSSSALFNAAVGGSPTVETFGDTSRFPISTGVLNSSTNLVVSNGPAITPGLIQPGVTYSTPIGASLFFNIDGGGGFTGGFLDSLGMAPLTVTFAGPVSGFGFDTNRLMGSSFNVTINFLSGSPYSNFAIPVADSLNLSFFGFKSSGQDIVSAVISGGSNTFSFALDNFTFSAVGSGSGTSVVPLPAPLLMLVSGLVTLGAFGRRKAT